MNTQRTVRFAFKQGEIYFILMIAMLLNACTSSSQKPQIDLFASRFEYVQGGELLLSDIAKGRALLVNFWATWCKPCVAEMPALQRLYQNLDSNKIEFVLVNDESKEKTIAFASTKKLPFVFVHSPSSLDVYQVYGLPTTMLIAKDGKVLEVWVGAKDWDSPEVLEQIKKAVY